MRAVLYSAIFLVHVACEEEQCEAGEIQLCSCDSVLGGEQVCNENMEWSDCECEDPPDKPLDGAKLYKMYCYQCHANEGQGGGAAPDIRARVLTAQEDEILEIILNGTGRMEPIYVREEEASSIVNWMKTAFTLPQGED